MLKRTLGAGLVALAIMLIGAASALALPWQGPLPPPVKPPVNGAFTTVIKVGGLTAECDLEEGSWSIVSPNEKDEGKVLDVEVAKYGECSASAPEKPSRSAPARWKSREKKASSKKSSSRC
jgi:hypothetical protein